MRTAASGTYISKASSSNLANKAPRAARLSYRRAERRQILQRSTMMPSYGPIFLNKAVSSDTFWARSTSCLELSTACNSNHEDPPLGKTSSSGGSIRGCRVKGFTTTSTDDSLRESEVVALDRDREGCLLPERIALGRGGLSEPEELESMEMGSPMPTFTGHRLSGSHFWPSLPSFCAVSCYYNMLY